MAWASTVLPAPVSPVSTLRPAVSRSSARSINTRFSTRSSASTVRGVSAGGDGSTVAAARRHGRRRPAARSPPPGGTVAAARRSARELAELLAQAAIEGGAGQLGEQAGVMDEAGPGLAAGGPLADQPAVQGDVDGAARSVTGGGQVRRRRHRRAGGAGVRGRER